VLSFWDERGAVNKAFLDEINASFPEMAFDAKVRRDVAVSRAVLKGQTVFDFDKDSRAAEDYKGLSKEFMARFERAGV
jgi:chromosome partitioning protein